MLEYKCPSCGGTLEFDTATQMLKCPYCDSVYDVEALTEQLEDRETDLGQEEDAPLSHESDEWVDENLLVYVCESCGGEVIGDRSMGATTCPYCGNNIVITKQFEGALKPDFIMPFKVDRDAAIKAMKSYFKGKKLLPRTFSSESSLQEIKGVYVPFWLYDMDADGTAVFEGTRTRHWSDSRYNYTETSYFECMRSGKASFTGIPADASSKMPDDLMDSIEGYDYSEMVPYNSGYLAGFYADKYDLDAESQAERVKNRAKQTVKDDLKNTVLGYVTVTEKQSNISTTSRKYRYALLPVWILNTKWNGRNFTFAMNGQTGKFVGNLPMDKGLYGMYFAISGLIGFAAAFLAAFLFSLL